MWIDIPWTFDTIEPSEEERCEEDDDEDEEEERDDEEEGGSDREASLRDEVLWRSRCILLRYSHDRV